jgi:polyhydroxyalkanoate synthesis regulator phasin
VAVLVEAAKSQQAALDRAAATVETQATEIDALTERLARLEAHVRALSEQSSTP